MTVLLVTARTAAQAVRAYAKECPIPATIHVCRADVASLLTMDAIEEELAGKDLSGVSAIIIPGGVKGDASAMAQRMGIPCFKGPKDIADLRAVLLAAERKKITLSSREPADGMIRTGQAREARKELDGLADPETYSLKIGSKNPVYLGCGISRVIAEINDAARLPLQELVKTAKYYLTSGAKIIDLGMTSGTDNSEKIPGLVAGLRKKIASPLSIDTLNADEILAAADSGIDLVLSIDAASCSLVDSLSVPVVVIPRDKKGAIPASVKQKKAVIREIMSKTGGENIILDPVLSPVNYGFSKSLEAYMCLREEYPHVPLMLGAGNVTELFDADSIGMNALLAGFASELSIDLLFTTEASPKTRGSVRELSIASEMMYLAKRRNQPPKDLPMDLLILKDKRAADAFVVPGKLKTIKAGKEKKELLEDSVFRISISSGMIQLIYSKNDRERLIITGRSAKEVYSEVFRRKLTRDLSHAAYLGRELGKAEIALSVGKNYVQDEELFPGSRPGRLNLNRNLFI